MTDPISPATDTAMTEADLPLRDQLNLETSYITWPEMERFFARGRVIQVDASLDLIDVGVALKEDNTASFQQWIDAETVKHLSDDVAKQWAVDDSNLWAVVIAPWVLVQERK